MVFWVNCLHSNHFKTWNYGKVQDYSSEKDD